MVELPTDFADLLVELLEADVRFLLVGGYAVAHHGHPRATKEIAGVDFESAWGNRDRFKLDEHEVPILGRAQLLVNKRAAGRPQDLADVDALERCGNSSMQ